MVRFWPTAGVRSCLASCPLAAAQRTCRMPKSPHRTTAIHPVASDMTDPQHQTAPRSSLQRSPVSAPSSSLIGMRTHRLRRALSSSSVEGCPNNSQKACAASYSAGCSRCRFSSPSAAQSASATQPVALVLDPHRLPVVGTADQRQGRTGQTWTHRSVPLRSVGLRPAPAMSRRAPAGQGCAD